MSARFIRTAPLAMALGAVTVLSACQDAMAPVSSPQVSFANSRLSLSSNGREGRELIADQYIVVLRDSEGDVDGRAMKLMNQAKGKVRKTFSNGLKGFVANMSGAQAAAIAGNASVAYIEQDRIVSIEADAGDDKDVKTTAKGGGGGKGGRPSGGTLSNVTQRKAIWNLDRIDQAQLPLNGTYTYAATGAGVNVYIVDTGIRPTHEEFGGRVAGGYNAVDDGLGTDDCNYHGTHVAGTVGGATVGVAKGVTLHPVRVLGCNGMGSLSDVIEGIDWVAANAAGPAVINLSLATWYSDALNEAVERAVAAGIVVVSASGNGADDACKYSPMSAPNAITVGATNSADVSASYSNFGSCVDILAPGDDITSASNASDADMRSASGTSMAAPHVAGAAALFLQMNLYATPAQVSDAVGARATRGLIAGLPSGTQNLLLRAE